jgi:hypothetical protein
MLSLCLLHAHFLELLVFVDQVLLKYLLLSIECGLHLPFNPSDGLISLLFSLSALLLFLPLSLHLVSSLMHFLLFLAFHKVFYGLLHFVLDSALLLHYLLLDVLLEFIH